MESVLVSDIERSRALVALLVVLSHPTAGKGKGMPGHTLETGISTVVGNAKSRYLEHGHSAGHDAVKVGPAVRVKSAAEDLHSEQGGDEDGQHEEDQQGGDAGDRVDQRLHQVAHAVPIPACHHIPWNKLSDYCFFCWMILALNHMFLF